MYRKSHSRVICSESDCAEKLFKRNCSGKSRRKVVIRSELIDTDYHVTNEQISQQLFKGRRIKDQAFY